MKNRKNIIVAVAFVLIFIIGFFAGMEYKSYQIRQAIGDVMGGVSEALSGLGSENKVQNPTSVPVAAGGTTSGVANDLNTKVSLQVVDKGFGSDNYQSQNAFKLKFTNNTTKDIAGVEGQLIFTDLFDNMIKTTHITYSKDIKAGQSMIYAAALEYNQFMQDDIKLKETDLSKLKYSWNVSMIVYSDGTKESI